MRSQALGRGVAPTVVWLLVAGAALGGLGVGGYRGGFAWVLLVLVGGGVAIGWPVLRSSQRAGWWSAALLVAGAVLAGAVVQVSPPSRGSLAATVSGIHPPFEHRLSERRSGHSWCLPHCPRLVEVWSAPPANPQSAVLDWLLALQRKRVAPVSRTRVPLASPAGGHVRIASAHLVIDISVSDPTPGGAERAVVTLAGRR